ncbi:polymeric immunoglobulin receptor-like, partial [Clarias magur]
CRLEGSREIKYITAYTGGSVLLPCSCTDLHTTPVTVTWEKQITNKYVEISPESEQYKDRFQLVNDHSSGNLSLLISHLTVEDGGVYRCSVTGGESRDVRLTVEGCTLNQQTVSVTVYVGQSVLLPCSCSHLQAKPHSLTWKFYKESDFKEIFPKDQTHRYTDRVQLFNDHHPGNLSLLISHLTVEDGGYYRCQISSNDFKDILVTVKATTRRPSTPKTPKTKATSTPVLVDVTPTKPTLEVDDEMNTHSGTSGEESLPFVPFAVVTVVFLHIIVAVVYCSTRKKEKKNQRLSFPEAAAPFSGKFCLYPAPGCLRNQQTVNVTGYVGQSVLLPCSCSQLQPKQHSLRWTFFKGSDQKEIFPKDQTNRYTDRVQLFNDHHPGNLSLLISHLTVEDGGYYRCQISNNDFEDVSVTVKGCLRNQQTVNVTGYVGQSVLLPCSCSHLQAKPHSLRWRFLKESHKEIFPEDQTNRYTDRVQLFNDHHPGNLSLLISHLTVEDGGYYRCQINNNDFKDILVTVKATTRRPSTPKTPKTKATSTPVLVDVTPTKPTLVDDDEMNTHAGTSGEESLPFVPFAVVTVVFLHIIVAVVYCSTRKKGCKLEGAGETKSITAYTGDSVLLPCSCTDLHTTPVTVTWEKDTMKIPPKSCRLEGSREIKPITAYTGDSVLLPCSCTDLHTTSVTVTWEKQITNKYVEISPESEQYKDRFQLVNDHSSGNLSLLISHLTVEDEGDYRCSVKGDEHRDFRLTVK